MFEFLTTIKMPSVTKVYCSNEPMAAGDNVKDNPSQDVVDGTPDLSGEQGPNPSTTPKRQCRGHHRRFQHFSEHHSDGEQIQPEDGKPRHPWAHRFPPHHHHREGFPTAKHGERFCHQEADDYVVNPNTADNPEGHLPNRHFPVHFPYHHRYYRYRERYCRPKPDFQERLRAEFDFL